MLGAACKHTRIAQVRKGGLALFATDLSCRENAGVNHPSSLVRFRNLVSVVELYYLRVR